MPPQQSLQLTHGTQYTVPDPVRPPVEVLAGYRRSAAAGRPRTRRIIDASQDHC